MRSAVSSSPPAHPAPGPARDLGRQHGAAPERRHAPGLRTTDIRFPVRVTAVVSAGAHEKPTQDDNRKLQPPAIRVRFPWLRHSRPTRARGEGGRIENPLPLVLTCCFLAVVLPENNRPLPRLRAVFRSVPGLSRKGVPCCPLERAELANREPLGGIAPDAVVAFLTPAHLVSDDRAVLPSERVDARWQRIAVVIYADLGELGGHARWGLVVPTLVTARLLDRPTPARAST